MVAIFVESDAMGRALSAHGQDFGRAARKEMDERRNSLQKIGELGDTLRKKVDAANDPKLSQTWLKSLDALMALMRENAKQTDAYVGFMLGFEENVRRQSDILANLDAALQKDHRVETSQSGEPG